MRKLLFVTILCSSLLYGVEYAYCVSQNMNGSDAKCYKINTSNQYLTNHVGNMAKDSWQLVSVVAVKGMNGVFYKFYFQRGGNK